MDFGAATPRDLHIVWGVNRWVLVERRDMSVERQVATMKEFAALLTEVGLSPEVAQATAGEQWKRRPRDAATLTARPGEGWRRATGTSPLVLSILFLAIFALFVVFIVVIGPHLH